MSGVYMPTNKVTAGIVALAIAPNLFMHLYQRQDTNTIDLVRIESKLAATSKEIAEIKDDLKPALKQLSTTSANTQATKQEFERFKKVSDRAYDRLVSSIDRVADKVEENGRVINRVQLEVTQTANVRGNHED